MKQLIKLAVGAAIAGALLNLLLRRRAQAIPTVSPLAEEPLSQGPDGGQPQEWGGGQSGLNS